MCNDQGRMPGHTNSGGAAAGLRENQQTSPEASNEQLL